MDLFSKREKSHLIDPKHIGLSIDLNIGNENPKKSSEDAFEKLQSLLPIMVEDNVPILSVFIPQQKLFSDNFFLDAFTQYLGKLTESEFIVNNQVRVSIIGKWYELPGEPVEAIKKCLEHTENYDKFFLNFCVVYDGQQEIIDAFRIIMKKMEKEDQDESVISKSSIKEHLYTSYFIPPDMVLVTGKARKLKGFLLWDSADSYIYFTSKYFDALSKGAMHDFIVRYRNDKASVNPKP